MKNLLTLIIERIQRVGPISFAEYMRMALYEPQFGYYVTGPAHMGWEGDYFTSSDLSALFAHCMARQLLQFWEQLQRPSAFTVVEQGAGRGQLAQHIQAWARQYPDFQQALIYHTDDIHNGQNALQPEQETLQPMVLLSNELVDAFPVHIVEQRQQQFYEVYVDVHHGRLHEVLDTPSDSEVATYLDTYKVPWRTFPDGWRAEINLDALQWMKQSALLLTGIEERRKRHSFLLAIDYGNKARALYTPERLHGTLACYYQHQFTERPLVRPGEQDITAHVNFSALINAGRQHGLRLHSFTTQHDWLLQMGIDDELMQMRQRDFAAIDSQRASDQGQTALFQWYNLRQRAATLTDRQGMGNFKVVIMKS